MRFLIINIGLLVNVRENSELLRGRQLSELAVISNAFLLIENDLIAAYGNMYELEVTVPVLPRDIIDGNMQIILPCWCDSHTHLIFAKSREDEFIYKLKGKTYAEIAAMGGGILHSAEAIQNSTEEELYLSANKRLDEICSLGTGAVEIKSGYGLSVEGELKMLRVIKRLKQSSPMIIRSTFLGAHAFPLQYKNDHEGYINLIINKMLPAIAEEGLADYIDVFCEQGFFSPSEMEQICEAGRKSGLVPKVHVNQLNSIGGLQAGIDLDALTVDHLEIMTDEDISLLARSNTIGTLLPTAAFFLRMQYQQGRQLIDEGCAIALASDYNPGSSPSGNMNFVIALSCIQMKLMPEEAINAATINGAYAMGVEDIAGSITVGKKANLIFMKEIPSLAYIPYSFGSNLIDKVMINGKFINRN